MRCHLALGIINQLNCLYDLSLLLSFHFFNNSEVQVTWTRFFWPSHRKKKLFKDQAFTSALHQKGEKIFQWKGRLRPEPNRISSLYSWKTGMKDIWLWGIHCNSKKPHQFLFNHQLHCFFAEVSTSMIIWSCESLRFHLK